MSKKVLFILMPKLFQDYEFNEPYELLKKNGYDVTIAGLGPGTAVGAFGLRIEPDVQLDALSPDNLSVYSALIIPGGSGSTKYLWNNSLVQKIVRYFHEHDKIVAAICYGVIALVQSDILKNQKATVYPTDEAKNILQKHHVTFVDDGVVVLSSEKIITAQGPTFAKDFAQALIEILA